MTNTPNEETQRAHEQLQQTLLLLSEKLDYPSRVDAALSDAKQSVSKLQKTKPGVFFAAVGAAALTAGAVVAALSYSVIKNL